MLLESQIGGLRYAQSFITYLMIICQFHTY